MKLKLKNLYRSRTNYKIAGVCGGIGEYLGIDPTLIRLAWILATCLGGSGIVAYIIAWMVIPLQSYQGTQSGDPYVII